MFKSDNFWAGLAIFLGVVFAICVIELLAPGTIIPAP